MKRLRHTATQVQVVVADEKAERLIADGTYAAVPDEEQPPKDPPKPPPQKAEGETSIAASINSAVKPHDLAAQFQ